MENPFNEKRRSFLKTTSAIAGAAAVPVGITSLAAPAIVLAQGTRPTAAQGIAFGDSALGRTLVWSRCDRPARMLIDYAFDESFRGAQRIIGPHALDTTDFTVRQDLVGLPRGRDVWVRVTFEDLTNARARSEPVIGRFRTPSKRRRDVKFQWGGDTAGQGWGINPDFGGMRIYETMRRAEPDFFIHSGDNIYADGPIAETVTAEGGRTWRNIVTPEVAKVAETLAEYRGRYKYNLLDENVRRFNAGVPQIWQWDDHEVTNNWSASKDLAADTRYTVKDVPLLIARGARAFLEYAPMRTTGVEESERVYRKVAYGPLLDVFVLDMRTYRGPNSFNLQAAPSAETDFLGAVQLGWLKRELKASRALWKVIAADMPVGLVIGDGKDAQGRARFEGSSNGDGPVLGREFELADLLRYIKREGVKNVVWVTADVHYCAAHLYDPAKAQFNDFDPFWEFVAGPLNAGSFGPNGLDNTFGPQVIFQKFPSSPNQSPFAGLQFYGEIVIDADRGSLTAALNDIDGKEVFTRSLQPSGGIHRLEFEDD
ncbi:MAG: alkaline phosphatase D family protein [Burkholderiales bacterium]